MSFLEQVMSGSVRVPPPAQPGLELPLGDARELLPLAGRLRAEAPGKPPLVLPKVAAWGVAVIYRACQLLVYRELGDAHLKPLAQTAPHMDPDDDPSAVAWSADIALHYLPDVVRQARGLSGDDPLLAVLATIGRRWPLSSVGIREVDDVADLDETAIVAHPTLLQVYVDRIIHHGATARLRHPAVRRAAARALGTYGTLAPTISAALQETAT